jgi:hypothetical protein
MTPDQGEGISQEAHSAIVEAICECLKSCHNIYRDTNSWLLASALMVAKRRSGSIIPLPVTLSALLDVVGVLVH